MVALGKRIAGVMGTDELCERVDAAGDRGRRGAVADAAARPSCARAWTPRSPTSCNVNADWIGRHAAAAALFLREFVPEGLPWAHIDIAGPSYHTGEPTGYRTKGGTGVPVRTLLATIEALIAD